MAFQNAPNEISLKAFRSSDVGVCNWFCCSIGSVSLFILADHLTRVCTVLFAEWSCLCRGITANPSLLWAEEALIRHISRWSVPYQQSAVYQFWERCRQYGRARSTPPPDRNVPSCNTGTHNGLFIPLISGLMVTPSRYLVAVLYKPLIWEMPNPTDPPICVIFGCVLGDIPF